MARSLALLGSVGLALLACRQSGSKCPPEGCYESTPEPTPSQRAETALEQRKLAAEKGDYLATGKRGYMWRYKGGEIKRPLGFDSLGRLRRIQKAVDLGDEQGYADESGGVLRLENNTRILVLANDCPVLQTHLCVYEVRVLDGKSKGKKLWATAGHVHSEAFNASEY